MARYTITGYDVHGEILLRTTHASDVSAYVERAAWVERLNRPGDAVCKVEVLDHVKAKLETLYPTSGRYPDSRKKP